MADFSKGFNGHDVMDWSCNHCKVRLITFAYTT